MRSATIVLAGLTFLCAAGLIIRPAAGQAPAFDPAGSWLGTLSVSGIELRLVFNITKTPDGALKATLDSPDQGAKGIPVESVKVEGNTLFLEAKALRMTYEGTYDPAAGTLKGTFTQGAAYPLTLKRVDKVPELNRPQTPKPPYPYLEENVSYENPAAGNKLAGTLTEPKTGGPFPAVLLITGSGSQDRDETIFGHKPFKVIADDLTRAGLAVLRVDDRGVGGSTGSVATATSEDFAGDVLTGVEYLKGRPDIDPKRIGLIGHSEGGLIAPMVAAESPDVAFIVLLAGTGVTGEQILYEQGALIARAEGAPEEAIAKTLDFQKKAFAVIKADKDAKAVEEKLRPILAAGYAMLSQDEKKAAGGEEQWTKVQVQVLNSPWMRFFLTYDPKTALTKVRCPVLAMGGSLDLQVPAKENLAAIGDALRAGGNANFKTLELPGLNHLFQTAKTGGVTEYARSEETIAPAALAALREWILSVTGLTK
jgi:fermentation-respiration switch protein FrsA (DUF1100 family)